MAALPGRQADFEAAARKAVDYAAALDCKLLHAMPGLRHHGANWADYIANLKVATKIAADKGVTIILEPINEIDIPGFFLNTTSVARAAIHEVGAPTSDCSSICITAKSKKATSRARLPNTHRSRATIRSQVRQIAASPTMAR